MKRFILLLCLAVAPCAGAAEKPYSLLIIQTDEHNFRTLGCYRDTLPPDQALMWGPAVVETPHIDWMAGEGALCTSFYATTPVCSPSRGSFVSGRYPQNTPVVQNNIPLSDDIVTFAELLKRAGYATGYAGKWHLDGGGKPQWAPARNFGFEDNRYMFNRGHWKKMEETDQGPRIAARKGSTPTYDVAGADEKSFSTDFLADKTIEFVRKNKGKPFCYWLSLPDPHGPDTVRAPYDTMYANQTYKRPASQKKEGIPVPNWGKGSANAGYNQAKYYGMVKCIDDNVGRIVDTLRETGDLDRTILVFTSDHGDLRGEHNRHNKGVPYEGSAKVAFVMRAPGLVKKGAVIDEAMSCVDFQPTVLAMLGVKPSGREEGRDASALFKTGKAPKSWDDIAFMRCTGTFPSWISAVSDRFKLVFSATTEPWLFDLEEDPNELVNAIGEPALRETVRKMTRALVDYAKATKDPFVDNPKVAEQIAWALSDRAEPLPTVPVQSTPNKKKKKKKRDV